MYRMFFLLFALWITPYGYQVGGKYRNKLRVVSQGGGNVFADILIFLIIVSGL